MNPTPSTLRILWICATAAAERQASPAGEAYDEIDVRWCWSLEQGATDLSTQPWDALVLELPCAEVEAALQQPTWRQAIRDLATLVLCADGVGATALRLIASGVQDVALPEQAMQAGFAARIAFAVVRKRLEREARTAFALDVHTGLPNQEQLLEHLSQLLALRERQPAGMAVLALSLDGLGAAAGARGPEAAHVLRRKVAVRLRAAVRSSDVVASMADDGFALLLSKIEAPADAQRVALKLARALREPFQVMGVAVGLSAHVGVAIYPQQGRDAQVLLRQALEARQLAQVRHQAAANDQGP